MVKFQKEETSGKIDHLLECLTATATKTYYGVDTVGYTKKDLVKDIAHLRDIVVKLEAEMKEDVS